MKRRALVRWLAGRGGWRHDTTSTVEWQDRSDGMLIRLVGHIDQAHHRQLSAALSAVERRPKGVTIDLEHATFVDSATLGVFAVLHSHSHSIGTPLVLYRPRGMVLKALKAVGFDRVMQMTDEP